MVDIITIAKNNESGLISTIESVREQTFSDWKLLLVIAESTDSTLEIAKKYQAIDSRIVVVFQEDRGIYQAMNLGMQNSKASYVWFLNSGDCYSDKEVLRDNIAEIVLLNAGFVIGGYKVKDQMRSNVQHAHKLKKNHFAFNRKGGCHQAILFDRQKIIDFNNYNTEFKIASDFDLCLKILEKYDCFSINRLNCIIDGNGFSDSNLFLLHKEKSKIRQEFFRKKIILQFLDKIWFVCAIVKIILSQKLEALKTRVIKSYAR